MATIGQQERKFVNGVDVAQLLSTIEAIKKNPELAKFRFRAKNEWISGGHSKTTIGGFYGVEHEDTSRSKPFMLESDEPPVLLGENHAPNAVEATLHALASCLSVGFIYNASAVGIKIDALEFSLEGDIDLQGFLGLSNTVRPGYQNIRLTYKVKTDAPKEKVHEVWSHVQSTSPVFDIIRNQVPISVEVTLK